MRQLSQICFGLILGWSAVLNAATPPVTPEPKQAVQAGTDTLLAKLVAVKSLYAESPGEFFREIDQSLAPFVDFDGFSRSVMAKYYRRATDEQQLQFVETFRKGLIETYSRALVEFDNQAVVVLDPSIDPQRPDRASIGLEIHGANNRIFLVEYSLVLVGNEWLLRNVVIEGINIGLQFRSQFAASMRKNRNDIDAVIQTWSVDV
jgi:phospholipid transport system substrate-binding protein